MKNTFLVIFCFIVSLMCLNAQDDVQNAPILFIYDGSGSMWGKIGEETKKQIAEDVLRSTVDNLNDSQKIGFMVYGHRFKSDCDDIELMVDLNNSSKPKLKTAVSTINPIGKTPLARSATIAFDLLKKQNTKATIILITDGIESCDGNICDVVAKAKEEGIEFRMHIVGFGIKDDDKDQLKCAADKGGGQYLDADNAGELSNVLNVMTKQSVDEPLANVKIVGVKNGKLIDALVSAYLTGTDRAADQDRSYGDTARLFLKEGHYDLIVKALENSDVSDIKLKVSKKQSEDIYMAVSFDAAILNVTAYNNEEGWDSVVKMINKETGKVEASTRTYGRSKEMEVDPGTYDVEFQALTMKGINTSFTIRDIMLSGGETQNLNHKFESGIARIGVVNGSELVDATVNFQEVTSGDKFAGGRTYTSSSSNPKEFLLNPGKYQVAIQSLGIHKGHKRNIEIVILSGKTSEIMLDIK